jgi:hypothetical protein
MHAPIRQPEQTSRTLEPAELRLLLEAESKIVSRARAWTGPHRLVVLGAAATAHVERLSHAVGSTDTSVIEHVHADSVETALRRITMQHVPRGHMMVLWLSSGMSTVSPVEARAILRAIRRCMWRSDLLVVGVDEVYPADAVATMLAAAAFQAGEPIAQGEYSVTVGVAD